MYHNPQQIAAERGIALPENPDTAASPEAISETKEEQPQEAGSPDPQEVEFHPGSVRLWNWKLPTEERFPYKTLPDQISQPSSPRGAIPFDTGAETTDGLERKISAASSSKSLPQIYSRRWSVGAVGSGGVGFPKELNEVLESLESPTMPNSPTTANSVAPLLANTEALNFARYSLERGVETTIPQTASTGLDSHGRGRPGPGRATISFDTPPAIIREKKMSTASSSAKSAASKSTGSGKPSFVDLPASLPFFRKPTLPLGASPLPLIQPRPPTGPWDDSPRYDIPFQNPAYVCPVDDFLWLPRNPCGKLNLDDSIEMRKAIRTEVHLGGLGEWIDDGTSVDVIPRNTVDSHVAVPGTIADADAFTINSTDDAASKFGNDADDEAGGIPLTRRVTTKSTSSGYTRKLLNGMERIHLPPGIRARVPKKNADEFGFKRRKGASPSVITSALEEVEASEGQDMKQEGYFTIRAKPSLSRPGWPSQLGRTPSKHSSPRAEGHISTSTLTIQRRTSSRSIFTRHSNTSRVSTTADVAQDPALLPDLSSHSPFADPALSIVITRSSIAGVSSPPHVGIEDIRRANSMFATGGVGDEGRLTLETVRGQGIGALEPGTTDLVMGRRLSHAARSVSSRTRSSRAGSVSVRDAIVGEVLAEEQIATAKRLREEMEEAERVAGPRSYWTGWMWRQVPNNNPMPPQSSSALGRAASRRDPVLRDAVGDAGPPSPKVI